VYEESMGRVWGEYEESMGKVWEWYGKGIRYGYEESMKRV
jgi:hypothetical protein